MTTDLGLLDEMLLSAVKVVWWGVAPEEAEQLGGDGPFEAALDLAGCAPTRPGRALAATRARRSACSPPISKASPDCWNDTPLTKCPPC
jgi:hypothetical protein